jgi:hypothetical protein
MTKNNMHIRTTDVTVLAWTCSWCLRKELGDNSLMVAKKYWFFRAKIFEQYFKYFSLEQTGHEIPLSDFIGLCFYFSKLSLNGSKYSFKMSKILMDTLCGKKR